MDRERIAEGERFAEASRGSICPSQVPHGKAPGLNFFRKRRQMNDEPSLSSTTIIE